MLLELSIINMTSTAVEDGGVEGGGVLVGGVTVVERLGFTSKPSKLKL
jgi:hypothetical protein